MKQVDYIVVGLGLAGLSFCEQLKTHNKTFVVFNNASQQSSAVAGGLYNPVVLKRFTPVWKCEEQLKTAHKLYTRLEQELGITLNYNIPVYRRFASLEEQNDWFTASDKPILSKYMLPEVIKNTNKAVNAPFGFGKVLHTGRIDIKTLINTYKKELIKKNLYFEAEFNYSALNIEKNTITYQNITAKQIVFAEGFGIKQNPYFNNLPLVPAKGELLIIQAPELQINYVLKANIFLIPIENDFYIVGTTYNWNDLTNTPTEQAEEELLAKLKKEINGPFTVINQVAGIRPTVKDRRPLVGRHQKLNNVYVLNGLGTRGVMIGPYVAQKLYQNIENKTPLETEIDCARFYK
ncbi:MAG: NAD(P)/FAD-dependent oxidoreductase [Flavobacteriaceae bacterium]